MTEYQIIDRAVPGFRDAWLIFSRGKHYIVSAVDKYGIRETMVFEASWDGSVTSWEDKAVIYAYDHEAAIAILDEVV